MISTETKEGLKRLLWEADWTYASFGIFKKHPILNYKQFQKWQKFNHGCWKLYWKIYKPQFKRIGYLTHKNESSIPRY